MTYIRIFGFFSSILFAALFLLTTISMVVRGNLTLNTLLAAVFTILFTISANRQIGD